MSDELSVLAVTPPPTPGPCPRTGCPPATEIVCILVDKVYDFCFESDILVGCTPIPTSTCPFPLPSGATAECNVDMVECVTGTPIPTGVDGFAALPVTVTVTSTITIRDIFGNVLCSFPSNPVILPKTIIVCSPEGVACDCFALVSCGNCTFVTPGGVPTVCCSYSICTIVECTAAVKLLVPSFGFCVPTRCVPRGFPPGQCPPTNLFPPQCTPTTPGD